jgi:hypothetical protein
MWIVLLVNDVWTVQSYKLGSSIATAWHAIYASKTIAQGIASQLNKEGF